MKKIIAIGGSNSKKSINKALATYAAQQVAGAEVIVADLNDLVLPLYGVDLEEAAAGLLDMNARVYGLLDRL